MTNYYKYFLMVCVVFLCLSCENKKTFIYKFNNDEWHFKNDTIVFTYHNNDISNLHDISIFFRNNINYPYRNIYLFVEISHNQEIIQIDTLQYAITDKSGRWIGNGIGDTRDNYFVFENDLKFPSVGTYNFNITHGMRKNPLIGCNKIGLKISENEQ